MATVSKWTPFDVALDITATGGTVTRTSATKYTVKINASWETYYEGAKTNYGMSASSGGSSVNLNTFGTKSSGGSGSFTGTYTISGNGSSTETITVTFRNFNSDNGNSATKTVTFNVTVPAWTSYTIKYNANGGTGAPGNQTKWKDQSLTLSNTRPTRTNYIFKGWGTSASTSTVAYAPGASYTKNAAVTLYAVWELAYKKPRIVNVLIVRSDSAGTASDEGTNALVTFDWECDKTVSSITIKWKLPEDSTWTSATVSVSGTSGTVSRIVGSNSLSTESSYDIHITVADGGGSSYATGTLPSMKFAVDFLNGGRGAAFGKTAELEDTVEFAFDAKFNEPVYGKALGMDRLPAIPPNSDLNNYMETGCYAVHSNDAASTIANIPVARAGRLEVWSSTGEGVRSEQWSYLRQRYIPYNSSNAVWERELARGSDNVWHYYGWWKSSLTPIASEKVYSKAAMTIALTANTTLGVVNTYTKVPLDKNVLSTSSRLTLEDNCIKIGSNIQHVKVNGQILLKCGTTTGNRHVRIQKISNGTTTSLGWSCVYGVASSNTPYPLTPMIVSVAEGDTIRIVFYTNDAADMIASGSAANGWQTYLTVEEL